MAFALSVSASIRRILTSGNRKSSGTRFRCCPIRMRRLFADTMSCIPARDRKERTSRAQLNFSLIQTASFAGSILPRTLPCARAPNRCSKR